MLFLDISLEEFFIKYPALKLQAEKYAKSHKFKVHEMKPYISRDFIGVYGELKDGCPVMISLPISNQSNHIFKEAMDTLLQ